jgi:hypothetical protein
MNWDSCTYKIKVMFRNISEDAKELSGSMVLLKLCLKTYYGLGSRCDFRDIYI